jgi:hypothetical protein
MRLEDVMQFCRDGTLDEESGGDKAAYPQQHCGSLGQLPTVHRPVKEHAE